MCKRMFIIVRKDLDLVYRMVQGGHALAQFALEHREIFNQWNNGYLIFIEVEQLDDLRNLSAKLSFKDIEFSIFFEPDINEITALACYESVNVFKKNTNLPSNKLSGLKRRFYFQYNKNTIGVLMGLDMYLYRAKNYKDIQNNEENSLKELCYWRKANMIHRYFMQAGKVIEEKELKDNEGVPRLIKGKDINILKTVLEHVIECPYLGPDLLPTQQGFFFGTYDYGEDYIMCLKDAAQKLKDINPDDNEEFIYDAWW